MKNSWKFNLVSVIAVGIVVLREVFPNNHFDAISLSLMGVAMLAFLVPRMLEILPSISKAKYKDFEIEFNQELSELETQVEILEQSPISTTRPTDTNIPPLHREYVDAYEKIASSQDANIHKVLSAAILSEKIVLQAAKDLELKDGMSSRSPFQVIKQLVKEGFITQKEAEIFSSFWDLRNKVVHGEVSTLTDKQTLRVMSLLWRIITVFG